MPGRGLAGALGAVAAVGLGIAGLLVVAGPTGFQPLGAPVVDLGVPVTAPAEVRDESGPGGGASATARAAGPLGPLGPAGTAGTAGPTGSAGSAGSAGSDGSATAPAPVVPAAPVVPPAPPAAPPTGPEPAVAPPTAPEPAVTAPGPAPVVVAPPAVPAEPRPAVLVFNNSRVGDLGERAAASLRGGGWSVRDVGSLSGRFRASTVYFEPGQRAAAERLADQFGLPRVLPRLAALPGSGLTVVVTRDWDS